MAEWKPVTPLRPREHKTHYLYRQGDLYPVVGARLDNLWLLEEGGAEDGAHRRYPLVGGSDDWQPTHYAVIDDLPVEGVEHG